MSWLRTLKGKSKASEPPDWSPAPELVHDHGLYNEAPEQDYLSAEEFCGTHPLDSPRMLSSEAADTIRDRGCAAWKIEWPDTTRFVGHIVNLGETKSRKQIVEIVTRAGCQDVCLLSNFPLAGGLYDIRGKRGIYYELEVRRMDGIIAIGTACRPYPNWRLPGWQRGSAGLHLDDLRKFFEDPDGGRDLDEISSSILSSVSTGDTIGCGYEFSTGSLFFTYNGQRLPNAFTGIYCPRSEYDVYAAVGVEGENEFGINFGGDRFRWKDGNEWHWRVEGHVGRLEGEFATNDELPSYAEAIQRC